MLFVQGYKDWFFLPPLINQRPRRTKLQVRISKQTIYLKLPSSSSSSVVTLTSSPCCSFSAESYRKQERALPVAACLCIWTAPVASFVKHTTGWGSSRLTICAAAHPGTGWRTPAGWTWRGKGSNVTARRSTSAGPERENAAASKLRRWFSFLLKLSDGNRWRQCRWLSIAYAVHEGGTCHGNSGEVRPTPGRRRRRRRGGGVDDDVVRWQQQQRRLAVSPGVAALRVRRRAVSETLYVLALKRLYDEIFSTSIHASVFRKRFFLRKKIFLYCRITAVLVQY